MMAKYVDDKIEYIEQDTLKIRTRPSMYISYKGSKGALHLAKEVINNAIDECINKNSPGDSILIVFDEKENKLTVMDNGRGIPLDKVELVCTKIQAGSKLYREADKQGVENKSFTAGPTTGYSTSTIMRAYLKVNGAWQNLIGSNINDVGGL